MAEPEPKEPSLMKKTRDDILVALRRVVFDAEKLPPSERVAVLREAATALATIDDAMTRSRSAFIDFELKKAGR